jgi:hypothetical protein
MALIFPDSKCAICELAVDSGGDKYVATSHFIEDETDPLWEFSDAVMHYDCFQSWERREVFVTKYNETMGRIIWGNGTRHRMNADGKIISVKANRE